MARKTLEDKPPKGGWLGPPSTKGLKAEATATKTDKKGNWIWKENTLSDKQKKKHAKFKKKMAKADKQGIWRF